MLTLSTVSLSFIQSILQLPVSLYLDEIAIPYELRWCVSVPQIQSRLMSISAKLLTRLCTYGDFTQLWLLLPCTRYN